ncbi:unnamed protein product [Musa acuminata subsp. burmannicoides]
MYNLLIAKFSCREVCFTIRTTGEKILETSTNYDDIIVLTLLSRDISGDKHHNNALIFLACTL